MPSSESRLKEGSIKSTGRRAGQEDHTVTGASRDRGSVKGRTATRLVCWLKASSPTLELLGRSGRLVQT